MRCECTQSNRKAPHLDSKVIRIEDLVNLDDLEKSKQTMVELTRFLLTDEYYQEQRELIQNRIDCIYPDLLTAGYRLFGEYHREKPVEGVHVTFDMAFGFLKEKHPEILCAVWQNIKVHALRHGYKLLDGVKCSENGDDEFR